MIGTVMPMMSVSWNASVPSSALPHLPRQGDHRSAIHPRVGDRRDEVRRARSARADAHADATRRARVALGRVTRALLVAAEHVVELVGVLRQRVIERHDRAARDAEDRVDALADERLAEDLGAGAECGVTACETASSVSSLGAARAPARVGFILLNLLRRGLLPVARPRAMRLLARCAFRFPCAMPGSTSASGSSRRGLPARRVWRPCARS